jgi:hypothetical protein
MARFRILILTATLLTACSAADVSPTPTLFVPQTLNPTSTQDEAPTTEAATSALTTEPGATPAEAAAATPTTIPTPLGRPEAPAPIEADFRPDNASHVAATGRPQMLEFFAYW